MQSFMNDMEIIQQNVSLLSYENDDNQNNYKDDSQMLRSGGFLKQFPNPAELHSGKQGSSIGMNPRRSQGPGLPLSMNGTGLALARQISGG